MTKKKIASYCFICKGAHRQGRVHRKKKFDSEKFLRLALEIQALERKEAK